ncbi:hypothetical protein SALBM311S_05201 [Streptomyces alboniger]
MGLHLDAFGDTVFEAAAEYAPHKLAAYLFQLASLYTSFYDKCPVLKAETPAHVENRLFLRRPHGPHPAPGHGAAGHQDPGAALSHTEVAEHGGPSSPSKRGRGPRGRLGEHVAERGRDALLVEQLRGRQPTREVDHLGAGGDGEDVPYRRTTDRPGPGGEGRHGGGGGRGIGDRHDTAPSAAGQLVPASLGTYMPPTSSFPRYGRPQPAPQAFFATAAYTLMSASVTSLMSA